MLRKAEETKCWRWLVDFRVYGDTTAYNAEDFFRTVLLDTAGRFAVGITLRVAVLIRPDFAVLSAGVPDADFQKRRGYISKTFTDEGQAMHCLPASAFAPLYHLILPVANKFIESRQDESAACYKELITTHLSSKS